MSSTSGIRNFASRSGMILVSVSHRATMRWPMSCAYLRSRTRLTMAPSDLSSGKFAFCMMMKSNALHISAMFCARIANRVRLLYGEGLPETIASGFTPLMCARKRCITPFITSHRQTVQAWSTGSLMSMWRRRDISRRGRSIPERSSKPNRSWGFSILAR